MSSLSHWHWLKWQRAVYIGYRSGWSVQVNGRYSAVGTCRLQRNLCCADMPRRWHGIHCQSFCFTRQLIFFVFVMLTLDSLTGPFRLEILHLFELGTVQYRDW